MDRKYFLLQTMIGAGAMMVTPFVLSGQTTPEYLKVRGPHGFTFLHHAQRGGEDAKELLEYLQGKGLKETKVPL